MKIGISLKIDVTKIDKSRIFVGKKGKYIDLTCFIDTENVSQYGDNGTVIQSMTPGERNDGMRMPILGNAKIFYTDGGSQPGRQPDRNYGPQQPDDDMIPF